MRPHRWLLYGLLSSCFACQEQAKKAPAAAEQDVAPQPTAAEAVVAATPVVEAHFSWHQAGRSILDVAFAPHTSELALVLQYQRQPAHHDGPPPSPLPANDRSEDPTISLLRTDTRQLTQVDYGWTPAFSPDGQRLAYSYQLRPMPTLRTLASTFTGNPIRLYDRTTRHITTVARPARTFLFEPQFTGPQELVYQIGDTTNGSYAGGVGLLQLNLRTRRTDTLYAVQRSHGHYHLLGGVWPGAGQLYYSVAVPQDHSLWMANTYEHHLYTKRGLAQSFGLSSEAYVDELIGLRPSGEAVLVGQGQDPDNTRYYLSYWRKGRGQRERALPSPFSKAVLSPDGQYLFYLTEEGQAFVLNTDTFHQTPLPTGDGEVQMVQWAADSRRLALIQPDDTRAATDVLHLYRLR
ncbi:WD40 repeat domain-containing protein [Hymenobacter guriensis]|uniref:PD40 domain-containing protein n=1 Tax=Hymenobacter guriensis TaxID=2793065 RepID=A0ABS0L7J2_9BACT|nr:PD40 domain-containing protein [Hymenobacter guriensis]MBG8556120.1 PD40 domain-containing protein [Hymenobacter guriensis]